MTREEYLQLRNDGNGAMIVYNYYVEKFDREKHKPFLSFNELFMYLNMWTFHKPEIAVAIHDLSQSIINKLDNRFSVMHLMDKEGHYIKSV